MTPPPLFSYFGTNCDKRGGGVKPKVIVLRGAGTNCDIETASSFNYTGAKAELVHINKLLSGEKKLLDFDVAAFLMEMIYRQGKYLPLSFLKF